MDLGLTNKTVLVTGASKGIGKAVAKAFAQEGANVVLVSRTQSTLDEAAAEISKLANVRVETEAADLSQIEERERVFAAHPDVDILVNNAGAIPAGSIHDIPIRTWMEAWQLKVFGYMHMSQLYVGKMKERKAGTIVNIVGMGGRTFRPNYICGAGGNAAVIGFTNALGAETPKYNVRVFGINPAATMTDRIITMSKVHAKEKFGDESRWEEFLDQSKMPFGRIKKPEEVAALATMLCAPQVHYLSGTVIDMDGGSQWAG
jgi:short-subunit dehydrogenase